MGAKAGFFLTGIPISMRSAQIDDEKMEEEDLRGSFITEDTSAKLPEVARYR